MGEVKDAALAAVVAALLVHEPALTAKELSKRLHGTGTAATKSRISSLLHSRPGTFRQVPEGSDRWVLAAAGQKKGPARPAAVSKQRQPVQRLAPAAAGDHDVCSHCRRDLPASAFDSVWVAVLVCRDCKRRPPPPLPATTRMALRRGGVGGYTEMHEGQVFITDGGGVWHLDADCFGRRFGQAEAAGMGYRLHKVRLVPLRSVASVRRPCKVCAY